MAKLPTPTSFHDLGDKIRVFMLVGPVAELYIDINKADGSSSDASVKPEAMVWGRMYRVAVGVIKKHFPGEFSWNV